MVDTRHSQRKRRNSGALDVNPSPRVLRSSSRRFDDAVTPRPNKKVRFSDPGPRLPCPDYSTGLTPAMCRTSFEESNAVTVLQGSPSRRLRRRSTPLPRNRRSDSLVPLDSTSSERVLHFTPLRQILDSRTQRRIRRLGLSEELNNIEREKRASAQYEKTLQSLLRERNALQQELELVKKRQISPESHSTTDDGDWMAPRERIDHLESQNDQLRTQLSFSTREDSVTTDGEFDTIMINDSGFDADTLLMSNSPIIRVADMRATSVPDDPSLLSRNAGGSAQPSENAELAALSHDLEVAKKEKRNLFDACRSRLGSLDNTALGRHLHQSSPPPDFLHDILPTLMQALDRASNATRTLDSIQHELSDLGFSGTNAMEIIAEMRDRFRSARLELERAVPGETAHASLNDGPSTLGALVKRVETLVKGLGEERTRHEGSADRERALRGQFDHLLVRYEAAAKKIHDLEDSISSSAADMLHTRMRMQELENEAQEHVIGIDRLNSALSKYHGEVNGLELLVTRLEDERTKFSEQHAQQISDLEKKIAAEENARQAAESTISERERLIRELEEVIEHNRIRFCDLTTKVERMERERSEAIENWKQSTAEQDAKHDQELGLMNVRVSELNTALEAAKTETEKLRHTHFGLEEQLRFEVEARDSLLDSWAAEQARSFAFMKSTVSSERRKAKARAANWEMKSDELQSETPLGSEPITPVSMTRFVDVEVGRGKHRRRLDSGIGILTEDELELLPSDPADL
ncbi:hypothetical protein ARAM_000354 [Aspergillus rambellii]|uniref:Uncharacterized protein n=1 Tax=Aspergillus rambellii TaxID=308745 RepID=A0A0F8V4S9_9EURO|nr:hypothetical protein ARAM_000354 [Aspergillus rambellii]